MRKITNNKGVQVAYDSVGASTYMQSMKSLAPLGYLVLYGMSDSCFMSTHVLYADTCFCYWCR